MRLAEALIYVKDGMAAAGRKNRRAAIIYRNYLQIWLGHGQLLWRLIRQLVATSAIKCSRKLRHVGLFYFNCIFIFRHEKIGKLILKRNEYRIGYASEKSDSA